MENKPVYYDGTLHNDFKQSENEEIERFMVTNEVRSALSGNPFFITE
ncbi:hypothetical protein H0266_15665 [Halobacillus locisalis]|uniref:Uncharacterized protein n=1 Tax=Halobacillus locisalis TaxID=220753 RepID=A0A838CWM7_9BACI|nr:hypothetical protein [Halobacillus locisalis]MBA2176334.1 hypothetical protein [Halobacillus locisalis]